MIKIASDKYSKDMEELKHKFLSMDLKEKRKLYRCKEKFKTLEDIEPWFQYVENNKYLVTKLQSQWLLRKDRSKTAISYPDCRSDLNAKISIFIGDITSLEIDAIVNAANSSLQGRGGVNGAIHRAAGANLGDECDLLNGCSTGDAKITCGYELPARYVLHTVGPKGENPEKLRSCYKTCLNLMKEHGLKSVAFPCISTSAYSYPKENAAIEVLRTIRTWFEENEDYTKTLDRIILCLFVKEDIDIYIQQMQLFFSVANTTESKSREEGLGLPRLPSPPLLPPGEIETDPETKNEANEVKPVAQGQEKHDSKDGSDEDKSFQSESTLVINE